jgi:hypothetical protein
VNLLGDLLFALDDESAGSLDAREAQPVAHLERVYIDDNIATSDIQVEHHEGASCHDGLDRIAVRRTPEVRRRLADAESKPVADIGGADLLQDRKHCIIVAHWLVTDGEIEISRRTGSLKPQFHRVAALEHPVRTAGLEKSREKSIERHPPPKLL